MNFIDILTNSISSTVGSISSTAFIALIKKIFLSNPTLEHRLSNPSSPNDFQKASDELAGTLEALAGTGEISIDKTILSALRSIRFNHQDGNIYIGNTKVFSPVIETGGNGVGKTTIDGNTELQSAGTSIKIGHKASIIITGNASIKQT